MVQEAREGFTPPSLIERVNILNKREGGLIEAYVPLSLINREDVPVDEDHVVKLVESMQAQIKEGSYTGQLLPVLLGETIGRERFDIMDGFHRVSALERLGKDEVYATIRPNCTPEEIMDLRIISATTHQSVKFARLTEWIEEAWQMSSWKSKITSNQALRLASVPHLNGRYLGLTSEENKAVQDWVKRKNVQWNLATNTLLYYLRASQVIDPDLIRESRDVGQGNVVKTALTPSHLAQLARKVPNDFETQRLIAETIKDESLTVRETRELSSGVVKAQDIEEARKIISRGEWRDLVGLYGKVDKLSESAVKKEPGYEMVLEQWFQNEIEVCKLLIENAVLSGRFNTEHSQEEVEVEQQPVQELIENDFELDEIEDITQEPIGETVPKVQLSEQEIEAISLQLEEDRGLMVGYLNKHSGIKGEDAEDIIQEGQLRLFTAISRGKFAYGGEKPLRSFMFTTLERLVIDRWRAKKQVSDISEISRTEEENLSEKLKTVDEGYEQKEYRNLLKQILPWVPVKYRRAFILVEALELSQASAASALGTTEGDLRVRLHRARRRIQDILLRK